MKKLFAHASSDEERYEVLLDLGKQQSRLPISDKTEDNRVSGCQSMTYVKTTSLGGKLFFSIESDALISAGLGQLLVLVYSGESPETVLLCPPSYLDELGIRASLTPGRANGLAYMFARMQRDAARLLHGGSLLELKR